MANELLDFVMGLVRDPDAAARYAADPSQAIADAHLSNVTSADVNNLIPMVSDSLSMAAPLHGAAPVVDSNVWTSGAATAAFDAFNPHADQLVSAGHDLSAAVSHSAVVDPGIDAGGIATAAPADAAAGGFDVVDSSLQFSGIDEVAPAVDDGVFGAEAGAWGHDAADIAHTAAHDADHQGFDLF